MEKKIERVKGERRLVKLMIKKEIERESERKREIEWRERY